MHYNLWDGFSMADHSAWAEMARRLEHAGKQIVPRDLGEHRLVAFSRFVVACVELSVFLSAKPGEGQSYGWDPGLLRIWNLKVALDHGIAE